MDPFRHAPGLLLASALLAGCGRDRVAETYPKGDPKLIRTYGWFGGETPENLKRERSFYFNGHKERDARYRHGALHGEYLEFWHNGQKKSRGRYVDGKKQGEWEYFFNQYQLSSKGLYRDDKKEGLWNQFWENGELKAQAAFRDGEYTGMRKEWNAKGELLLENSCFERNDTGRYVSYHANKTPKENYRCLKGRPVGAYERKDPDGMVVERGAFDSLGRKDGVWETFHPEGGKASHVSYRAGAQEDSALAWYADGSIKERGFYRGGAGELLGYDSLGHLTERRRLVNGTPDGESRTFYPDGKPRSLILYRDGVPQEMAKWHPNGQLWAKGRFTGGKRTGEWKQFDERGRPTEISRYADGILQGDQVFYDSLGRVARAQRYEHGYPAAAKLPTGVLRAGQGTGLPMDTGGSRDGAVSKNGGSGSQGRRGESNNDSSGSQGRHP